MGRRSEKTKKPNLQTQDLQLSDFLIPPIFHFSFFISHCSLFTIQVTFSKMRRYPPLLAPYCANESKH